MVFVCIKRISYTMCSFIVWTI